MKLDTAIIGGGPAGMSAALVLGRARKSVIVIDEGRPRNRVTRESHGFLTRDGIAPAEFRRIAREQIEAYPSVRFLEDAATAVAGVDGDFHVATASGASIRAKKLLFAAGKKDVPPNVPGLQAVYGKSAFVCPYCDGWELRDRPLALIANGPRALHLAKTISGWSGRFVVLTNGPDGWSAEQREELARRGIPAFAAPIRAIESEDGMVRRIELHDGTIVNCEGIFFAPTLAAGSELPAALGCRMTESGSVVVDAFGKTNVPGVYCAGDAASELYQIASAVSMGSLAGVGMNSELLEEAWNASRPLL
jgi:thioredoxin reductase